MAIYTSGILAGIVIGNKTDLTPEIYDAAIGSKNLKKEMLRIFQKANRRAQNIENADLISPALQALKAERGSFADGYSKFSISGLNINNADDWTRAKQEYNRALQFLNNPTSTARGARQYTQHIADTYTKGDFTKAKILLEYVTKPEITDLGVNAFQYKAILENFQTDVMEIENDLTADEYAAALEDTIQTATLNLQREYARETHTEIFLADIENVLKDVDLFPFGHNGDEGED